MPIHRHRLARKGPDGRSRPGWPALRQSLHADRRRSATAGRPSLWESTARPRPSSSIAAASSATSTSARSRPRTGDAAMADRPRAASRLSARRLPAGMRAGDHDPVALAVALAVPAGAVDPARCWPTRRSKPARARSARNSAAWSARTSRSTIPTPQLAHDLRILVRERVAAGDSDGEVDRLRRLPLRRLRSAQATVQGSHLRPVAGPGGDPRDRPRGRGRLLPAARRRKKRSRDAHRE